MGRVLKCRSQLCGEGQRQQIGAIGVGYPRAGESKVSSLVKWALPRPVKCGASSPLPFYFNTWFNTCMVTCGKAATYINTDPSCSGIMDPDMAKAAAWTQMSPWPWVSVQDAQIYVAPAAACPSNNNMTSGVSPGPGHLRILHGHQHRHCGRVGLWTHTQLVLGSSSTQMIPWPQVSHRPDRLGWLASE